MSDGRSTMADVYRYNIVVTLGAAVALAIVAVAAGEFSAAVFAIALGGCFALIFNMGRSAVR